MLMTEIKIEKRYGAGQEYWRWLYLYTTIGFLIKLIYKYEKFAYFNLGIQARIRISELF